MSVTSYSQRMGAFLTLSRHEIIDLASPWGPERLMQEYLADPKEEEALETSADDLSTLVHEGAIARFSLERRWMGKTQSEKVKPSDLDSGQPAVSTSAPSR